MVTQIYVIIASGHNTCTCTLTTTTTVFYTKATIHKYHCTFYLGCLYNAAKVTVHTQFSCVNLSVYRITSHTKIPLEKQYDFLIIKFL